MKISIVFISSIVLAIAILADFCRSNEEDNRQLYIVYMGALPDQADYSPEQHHRSLLHKVASGTVRPEALYRSYGRSFNGFAAWLNDQERDKLKETEGVLSVFPSKTLQFHTTRSWDFLGVPEIPAGNQTELESDIIIGVIDSGIWPGSKSFRDDGIGPVPNKWKGTCQGGPNFNCNKKIIGARFGKYLNSAHDDIGHGTYMASIAGGSRVTGASFYETLAKGTARGGAPSARIAVYKVCSIVGCISADVIAAYDDAIADGVDVITISIEGIEPIPLIPFYYSENAIGSFHAMARGIVTVNSAGNTGPRFPMLQLSPWLVSVGASSIDRTFVGKVVLGDGTILTGLSLNTRSLGSEANLPLVYASRFDSSNCTADEIRACSVFCYDKDLVAGKIVICESKYGFEFLQSAGAAGVIYVSNLNFPIPQPLPSVGLRPDEFDQVLKYANTTEPRATILASEDQKDVLAPYVYRFSARGPNYRFPDIMKPDVVAPGIGILAAYPPKYVTPLVSKKSNEYNIMTGTSVACPHAAGALAYVKSLHPDWSPAALKSALMTTARPMNASLNEEQEFAYGSGQIDPVKAADPGLVYDISKQDYIDVLCGTYDEETCRGISGGNCQCSEHKMAAKDLNYPIFTSKIVGDSHPINVSFTRIVTNVGKASSTYKAVISVAPNLTIKVVPDTLVFTEVNEKKSFEVQVMGEFVRGDNMASSSLVWSDGTHAVRSPIVVYA